MPESEKHALSLPRRHSDPIWMQDFYLQTGHDASTRSGTGTFIKRREKTWLCTCRHIMDAVKQPGMVPGSKYPTLALAVGQLTMNLGNMGKDGVRSALRAPEIDEEGNGEIDIAICPIDHYWQFLVDKKSKLAIDLDDWREPSWSALKWGIAAGYPDEHKKNVSSDGKEHVSNQLINSVARIASNPSPDNPHVTTSSELDDPHSWYFSGLSGGPLYGTECDVDDQTHDDDLFPIGIVFEGYPSSGRPDILLDRDAASAFLTNKDLFFRALTLTPAIFDTWLRGCRFL